MYTEKDALLSCDSGPPTSSSCCLSSVPSLTHPALLHRRGLDAPPLPWQHFPKPEPHRVEQKTRSSRSFSNTSGLVGQLLTLLRASEYDVYHVQCVATEAMASLQVVRLHLIECTLNATVVLEEARAPREGC
ncbi:hypothetical protein JKF63_04805 [Porcisia hertigi]|uniref:Uncharacterized protein n=1 Tax=Porcisia hertigi TaxID=2761500 RepID=A0A836IRQ2_9TRYP|nr:hypothetical protein JKF63_04805 [Porcisia hertigi]